MAALVNILVIVNDSQSSHDALAAAFRIGQQFDAHVDALHVQIDPAAALPLVGDAMSGVMVDEMMSVAKQEAEGRTKKARNLFDRLVAEMNVPRDDGGPRAGSKFAASWIEDLGIEENIVAVRACRADVIVLPRHAADHEAGAYMTLNAALLQSGRPVVAAPPIAAGTVPVGPFERIALFWSGSPEAVRAITAALPFLRLAKEITVLRVKEEEWFAPIEDLEVYLIRHGVSAGISKVLLPDGGDTGHALLASAQEAHADLLVMGAYTRSKLRQLIFGSVTAYVLDHAKIPALLNR